MKFRTRNPSGCVGRRGLKNNCHLVVYAFARTGCWPRASTKRSWEWATGSAVPNKKEQVEPRPPRRRADAGYRPGSAAERGSEAFGSSRSQATGRRPRRPPRERPTAAARTVRLAVDGPPLRCATRPAADPHFVRGVVGFRCKPRGATAADQRFSRTRPARSSTRTPNLSRSSFRTVIALVLPPLVIKQYPSITAHVLTAADERSSSREQGQPPEAQRGADGVPTKRTRSPPAAVA